MEETLKNFLIYISDNCTDSYGHLQVVMSEDENIKKEYYSQTVEGIVKEYMKNNKLT